MSTEKIAVVLVVLGRDPNLYASEVTYAIRNHVPLVVLLDDPEGHAPENIEWHSIIKNSGDKPGAWFRAHAVDILRSHTNLDPVAVIEHDPRFIRTWDIPLLVDWRQL